MAAGRLEFGGSYTPTGRLDFGTADRTVVLTGRLPAPSGRLRAAVEVHLSLAGKLPALAGRLRAAVEVHLSLAGKLPALAGRVQILVGEGVYIALGGRLPSLEGRVTVPVDINVWRGLVGETRNAPQTASVFRDSLRDTWQAASDWRQGDAGSWQEAASVGSSIENRFRPMHWVPQAARGTWQDAIPVPVSASSWFTILDRRRAISEGRWRKAANLAHAGVSDQFQILHRIPTTQAGWWQSGRWLSTSHADAFRAGRRQPTPADSWWQTARPVPPGISPIEPPEPPEPTPCYFPDGQLNFGLWATWLPVTGRLIFRCDPFPPHIPIREVYIVTTTATLVRLSDGAEIDTTSFNLQADMDSSYWRLSAGLVGRTTYNLLQPVDDEPMEVALIVSGCPEWHFVVDKLTGNLGFLNETFSLTARSRAALLGAGWARARTYTETASRTRRQLADQELLNTDWTLDPWNVPDWLIPTGILSPTWSYQGLTPMEAIRALVDVDGYLLPHPNESKIGVYPRYSVLPWHWHDVETIPDLVIPSAVVTSVGMEPRFSRDAGLGMNAVFVRGIGTHGGFWKVKRAGTAGDVMPDDTLTSALMTHVDGARIWGSRWLADAEPLVRESIELPLDPGRDIPLLQMGSLLEYSTQMATWRGIVRDFSLNGRVQGEGLVILQSVTVERHYEPV